MGFPYFVPIYVPGSMIKVFEPVSFEDDPLEDVVKGQMKYRYFPVNIEELAADITYGHLREEPELDLGNHRPYRNVFITDPEDPEYDEGMAYEGEKVAPYRTDRQLDEIEKTYCEPGKYGNTGWYLL